jgi:hypothetical protein
LPDLLNQKSFIMRPFTLKCFTSGATNFATDFFILSKGNNAGKPLTQACPNCFVLSCENIADREFYYWLCFGLWQAGMFRPVLSGSVIPFLRMYETVEIIKTNSQKLNGLKDSGKILDALKTMQQKEIVLSKQMGLLQELKTAVVQKLLK